MTFQRENDTRRSIDDKNGLKRMIIWSVRDFVFLQIAIGGGVTHTTTNRTHLSMIKCYWTYNRFCFFLWFWLVFLIVECDFTLFFFGCFFLNSFELFLSVEKLVNNINIEGFKIRFDTESFPLFLFDWIGSFLWFSIVWTNSNIVDSVSRLKSILWTILVNIYQSIIGYQLFGILDLYLSLLLVLRLSIDFVMITVCLRTYILFDDLFLNLII